MRAVRQFIRAKAGRKKDTRETLKSIPEVTLDEIIGDRKIDIKLIIQKHEDGMMWAEEAQALLSILVMEKPEERCSKSGRSRSTPPGEWLII